MPGLFLDWNWRDKRRTTDQGAMLQEARLLLYSVHSTDEAERLSNFVNPVLMLIIQLLL